MAGTLVISTLSDGTNSTSSTNCIQGSAKAWVRWNASGTIAASYNVSSVTVNGTSDYTVNFTSALSDTNYSVAGSAGRIYTLSNNTANLVCLSTSTFNTTSVRVGTNYVNGGGVGAEYNSVAVFR